MQDSFASPGSSRTSLLGRPFRWFMNLDMLGRCIVLLGLLVMFACLFYVEENWRGKRTWENYRRELAARGMELDFQKFTPPPVPDEQNMAMTPFLAPLFDFNPEPRGPEESPWRDQEGHERAYNFAAAIFPGQAEPHQTSSLLLPGRMTDLEAAVRRLRQQTNFSAPPAFATRAEAATALLVELEQFRPVLDELRAASQRPHCRFNIKYDTEDPASIMLPHLQVLRRTARVFNVRASAELALGKVDAAFNDVDFIFVLTDMIREEPFVISILVRTIQLLDAEQVIWEGLAGHQWSDAQLRGFQARLEKITLISELDRSMRAEAAGFGNRGFDFLRTHPHVMRQYASDQDTSLPLEWLAAAPRGWMYFEQATYHRLFQAKVLSGFDPQTGRVYPRIRDENRKSVEDLLAGGSSSALWHHQVLSKLLLRGFYKVFPKITVAQSGVNEAAIACALERHRLAHGKYPETLAALAPQFIGTVPFDICSGQALKYRRTDDGQFALYSVGWNETDDGGKVPPPTNDALADLANGDWTWPTRAPD